MEKAPPSQSKPPVVSVEPARLEQKTLTTEAFSLRPPKMRDRAVLVRMDGIQAGQVASLDGPETRIGRNAVNTIVVDDEGMSRSHVRVFYEDGQYFAEDLGSSNGTYVNGDRITRKTLSDGVVLQLGPRVCFRFSLTDEHQEKILRQLYESSVRDGLTGAYNRHFLKERLATEVAYAARHNSQTAVVMFDVDHFKKVNDTYGHPAGDAVLKTVSATTHRMLRTEDILARYGGEEFVLLLRGVGLTGAAKAGERLRRAIEASTTTTGGEVIRVTVSVGCATAACAERLDPDAIVSIADRRLYLAKKSGRNRVVAEG
ncbi:MAG TPA: GGDEF domain-containing protein [Polyangiaceae bacterium]|nr:GGDEF domain-containing protein [Polyangiaceae bacterium]